MSDVKLPGKAAPRRDGGGMGTPGPSPAPAGTQQVPMGVLVDPAAESGLFPLIMGVPFRRRAWDPELYAEAVVAEFAAGGWEQGISMPPPPTDPSEISVEIGALVRMAKFRAERAPEIAAQSSGFMAYWADTLMLNPQSHPATWDLIMVANAVGHMVGMHFKRKFMRPRPVQHYPALMPPMLTPPHPSYPSNHMLQCALIAASLRLVLPFLGDPGETAGPLDLLARRIGENREIAGLHFPSDTKASLALAPQLMERLVLGALHKEIVEEARAEWVGVEVLPAPLP